jgi:hypothetical protein
VSFGRYWKALDESPQVMVTYLMSVIAAVISLVVIVGAVATTRQGASPRERVAQEEWEYLTWLEIIAK